MSLCGLALAVDDKKEAARKVALEGADKKAFAENMAATVGQRRAESCLQLG